MRGWPRQHDGGTKEARGAALLTQRVAAWALVAGKEKGRQIRVGRVSGEFIRYKKGKLSNLVT